MKNLTDILIAIVLGFIAFVVTVLLLPIMIVTIPFAKLNELARENRLKKYLHQLGDKNFFCYNNRADAKDFIEKEVIPRLERDIEIIYLDGQLPKSNYETDQISLVLYKLKNYHGFPHLLKIRNGEMIDESINNELFNTMNQNKPLDKLMGNIKAFFSI